MYNAEWQQQSNSHIDSIRVLMEKLSANMGSNISERAEEAVLILQKGKSIYDYRIKRREYLEHTRNLFDQISSVETKCNQTKDSVVFLQVVQDLPLIATKSHQDIRGDRLDEPNKALLRAISETVKRAADECCDRFVNLSFVNQILPILGKLMKQHVLASSDVENNIAGKIEIEALQAPRSLIKSAEKIDEAALLCKLNTNTTSQIVKLYSNEILKALTSSAEEISESVLANLKTNENPSLLLDSFLTKFHHLIENTWALTMLLFQKENKNKHSTTRAFLFQPLPHIMDLKQYEATFQTHISSLFESQFSALFKQITKKNSSASLKNAVEMLKLMHTFYGNPTGISYIPLLIYQNGPLTGNNKTGPTVWTMDYINQQLPLIELSKYIFKTIDSSPPGNISEFFSQFWGNDDAAEISDKFIDLLHFSVILAVVSDSHATLRPSPTESVTDFINAATTSIGEKSQNVTKAVVRSMQKFLSQPSSLSTISSKNPSFFSTVNNWMEYETVAIYKKLMPDVLSAITALSQSQQSSHKKSKYQDLL